MSRTIYLAGHYYKLKFKMVFIIMIVGVCIIRYNTSIYFYYFCSKYVLNQLEHKSFDSISYI